MNKPLAIKLAPKSLKDVLGQEHLIGKGKILTNLVKNKKLFSMILYGPPGIGKTSIANALVNDLGANFIANGLFILITTYILSNIGIIVKIML